MGILDSLRGDSGKELEELRREIAALRSQLKISEAERSSIHQKYIDLIDKTHAFMERLKILVGTLDNNDALKRCWDLLDLAIGIKKGAIYRCSEKGWLPDHAVGFKNEEGPVIPLKEDSLPGFVAEHGVILSLAHLHKQDDLAYLERRGVIPDCKIVCPVRVDGRIEKLIIICSYSGNVFSGEDDLEIVQMVATVLGLVLSNAKILYEQKSALDKQRLDFTRLRNLFSSMVAPEVISFIEKNPDGIVLGGKKQKVAILFADIRDFTELADRISPERTIELLNRFFTLVTDIVINTHGTLDKFMGDAAMALYGTPVSLENPSLYAVRAALQIQRALEAKMPQWVAEGFPEYSIGIGINYQEVIVGNVGSQRLSNFTAIGDGVNLASRLCAVARSGETLISGSCCDMLEQWPGSIEERYGVVIKGKAEPITVYCIRDAPGQKAVCPQCGVPLPLTAKFCGECGFRRS